MITTLIARLKKTIHKIVNTGTQGIIDDELITRITLVNSLSLAIVILIICVGSVYYAMSGQLSILLPASFEASLALSPIFLNHYKKHHLASLITFFTQCLASLYFGLLLGNIIELQAMVIFLFLITFLIFKDKWTRRICIVTSMGILFVLEANYYDNFVSTISLNHTTTVIFKALSVMGVMLLVLIVGSPYVASNDALHKANHFKRMFVYQVTHEMRTPLNAIYGAAQLLKREAKLDINLRKIMPLIDHLLTATNNTRRIINDVLDMAQIESGKIEHTVMEVIELTPFINKITDVNRIIARSRQIKIGLTIHEMPQVIICDTLKLNQVITNLLGNAIKYADKNTTINIHVTRLEEQWQMQFVNQGTPIPEAQLSEIFEPFVGTRNNHTEGTGLGLYIVKNKVKAMNGSITVSSSASGETCFTLCLPLTIASLADIPAGMNEEVKERDLSNIHVMMAEDDEINSKILQMLLQKIGCEVTATTNGIELLEQVQKNVPDMIIMDYHMQGLNGVDTLKILKALPQYAHIPVIIATGDVRGATQQVLLEAGASAVLEKPVHHSQLLSIMNQHIRHFDAELQERV
ncbi:hybrid sensor histidine kinase/response regulator [Chitinophaga arvensicola]|uniref:histidine kinase n=1 Tax=Chitinophaga arvensicola TaxID=29529 RepID=A0A1I0SAD3_9BACT|nr:hybrid sensor histidine kinase/response regulator [Chitinophaga arvensicola]SEW53281.1 His Kinase A (phospho-acceptor) domain-containing protein [Chitinophaga arvensicola]